MSLSAPLQTQSISDGQGRRRIENDNVASILDASYRIVEPFEEQPEIVTVFCTRQEGMSNSRSMSSRLPETRSTSGIRRPDHIRQRTSLVIVPDRSIGRFILPEIECRLDSEQRRHRRLRVQVDAKDAIALEAEKMG
jgi:hypothetical protein